MSLGTNTSALVTWETTINASPIGDQNDPKARNGRNQIVKLWNLVKRYDASSKKEIDAQQAFDYDLLHIREECERSVQHIVTHLAGEVDHCESDLTELKARLKGAKSDCRNLERSNRALVSPFLLTFLGQLKTPKEILRAALASVARHEEAARPQGGEDASEALLEALKRQTSAILMISSRIAKIKSATRDIGPELRNLLARGTGGAPHEPDDLPDLLQSGLASVKRDYDEFWLQGNWNLDKRQTNPITFKDRPSSGTA
jgi:chromosome segregation ATPase